MHVSKRYFTDLKWKLYYVRSVDVPIWKRFDVIFYVDFFFMTSQNNADENWFSDKFTLTIDENL